MSWLCCCAGADSLASDRLGCFNLPLQGHRKAVEFIRLGPGVCV